MSRFAYGRTYDWTKLVTGILLILMGILGCSMSVKFTASYVTLISLAILAAGIFRAALFTRRRSSIANPVPYILLGILDILLGLLLLFSPASAYSYIGYFIAFWAIGRGLILALESLKFRSAGNAVWWLTLISGACGFVLGVLLLFMPVFIVAFSSMLFGLAALIFGVFSLLEFFNKDQESSL